MLVSLNWLKQYVDFGNLSPEQLKEKITKSGIEVDAIHYITEEASSNIVVGYVETCEKHPDADKLNVCHVDVGTEKLQIVCGADNVASGQKVVVATPGAVLPGNIKIIKVKYRGVVYKVIILSYTDFSLKEKILLLKLHKVIG